MIGLDNLPAMEATASLWPAALTMALVGVHGQRSQRLRRRRMNELLHELRRPLQVLALADRDRGRERLDPLELALHALRDLDREVNDGPAGQVGRQAIDARRLLDQAATRWRGRAARCSRPLRVRWMCDAALIEGDPKALSQALDNLIANSLEHGTGAITLIASIRGGALEIDVRDAGARQVRPRGADHGPHHGHGLHAAGRVAEWHGGSIELRRSRLGTVAALRLPLLGSADSR